MKQLSNLDLGQNQIQNAVAHPLSAAPSAPKLGQFYFSTSANVLYCWNGSSWRPADAAALTDGLDPDRGACRQSAAPGQPHRHAARLHDFEPGGNGPNLLAVRLRGADRQHPDGRLHVHRPCDADRRGPGGRVFLGHRPDPVGRRRHCVEAPGCGRRDLQHYPVRPHHRHRWLHAERWRPHPGGWSNDRQPERRLCRRVRRVGADDRRRQRQRRNRVRRALDGAERHHLCGIAVPRRDDRHDHGWYHQPVHRAVLGREPLLERRRTFADRHDLRGQPGRLRRHSRFRVRASRSTPRSSPGRSRRRSPATEARPAFL